MLSNEKGIETSGQMFEIIEDGFVFKPYGKVNGIAGKFMQVERFEDGDDGTFPRVSDYTRLANKMDNEGVAPFLTWAGKSKLKFDTGYCTITRDGKYSDKAIIDFKKPIKVVVAYLNDEPVMIEVNRIHGEFTFEWYWTKGGRQDKIANGAEIYFDCQKFELIKKEFIIFSNTANTEVYTINAENTEEARHWVINHCDTSITWTIKEKVN